MLERLQRPSEFYIKDSVYIHSLRVGSCPSRTFAEFYQPPSHEFVPYNV